MPCGDMGNTMNKVAVPEGAAGSPPFREWPECVHAAMHVTARTSQLKSCSNASCRTAKSSEQSRRVPGCNAAWSIRESVWEGRPAGSGNLQKKMRVRSAVLQAPEATMSPRGNRSTLQRSRGPAAPGPHGPLAQLVRAHG
jgi:hypothetical protein